MKIDKTAQVSGGGLFTLELSGAEIHAVLDPVPVWLESGTVPNTVSITSLFVDSSFGSPGPTPPEPGGPNYEFFGRDTTLLGLGGAPPYITGYPIGGPMTILSELPPFPEPLPNYGTNQVLDAAGNPEGDGIKDTAQWLGGDSLWEEGASGTMLGSQTSAGWADNPTFLIGALSSQNTNIYWPVGGHPVTAGEEYVFEFDCVTAPAGSAPKFALRTTSGGSVIYGPFEYGVGHVTSGVVTIPVGVSGIFGNVEYLGADAGQTWHIDNVKLRQILP
jgi:hypothetical protein